MKNNLLRMGYVMVSRALLQEICEKKGAACCEEEAFLRVLTNVNFKPAVVFCNGAGVQCARGESVITFMGWADIFGWTRARTRRFFDRCFAAGLIERVPGCCPSHIHVPGYDAWTGQPASIGKVMNGGGSFSAAAAPRCRQVEILRRFRRVAEGVSCLLRPHHPPAGGERQLCPRPLEKTLHPRARTCLPESGRLLFQPEQYAFLLPGCQISGI